MGFGLLWCFLQFLCLLWNSNIIDMHCEIAKKLKKTTYESRKPILIQFSYKSLLLCESNWFYNYFIFRLIDWVVFMLKGSWSNPDVCQSYCTLKLMLTFMLQCIWTYFWVLAYIKKPCFRYFDSRRNELIHFLIQTYIKCGKLLFIVPLLIA